MIGRFGKQCYRQSANPIGDITPIPDDEHPNFKSLVGTDFTYTFESVGWVGTYTNTGLAGFISAFIFAGPLNRPLLDSEVSINSVTGVFKILLGTQFGPTDTFVIHFNW